MARRTPSELNLLLAVDKPVGMTSHDVVSRVRRALGERRVGHAGTLDPLASGVMILGVGQATRLLGRISLDRKAYIARILFGYETTTDDAEGEIVRQAEISDDLYSQMFATSILREFLGEQEQVPPAYSAISINGVRSYKRARAGEDFELPSRTVEVFDAQLISIDTVDGQACWTCMFDVSKGTYIRSLARDIGRAAGNAAHILELRRTASGSITIGSCLRLEDLSAQDAQFHALNPVKILDIPMTEISEQEALYVQSGRAIDQERVYVDAKRNSVQVRGKQDIALVYNNELVAIAQSQHGKLVMKTVFPQVIGGITW